MTLQEILKAKGLDDEAVESVIGEMKQTKIFTASEENLDIRYSKLKADHDNLTAQHGESTKLIEQMKAGAKDNEALQGKITSYESTIATLQQQLKDAQMESAIKVALLGAKAMDVDYLTFKLKEKGELELDDQGNIKGIDDKLAGLKTQFPNQFESAKNNGFKVEANPLPESDNNRTSVTKEQFDRMGYQSRLKLKQEQPDVYAQMTGKNDN